VGHVTFMGRMRNVYRSLVGKAGGKRPLRRPSDQGVKVITHLCLVPR
jgi:hypothetical protein